MLKTVTAAALLGSLALGGLADAQTAPSPVKPAKADISRADFLAQAETRFARMDTNRDGVLTPAERRAGKPPRRARGAMGGPYVAPQDATAPHPDGAWQGRRGGGVARMDSDGDGRVTRAEFDTAARTRFERMDGNRDGTIDATEMAALPGGGRGMRADTNADGKLTQAEYDAQSRERFDRIDVNRDGVLDTTELQAGPGMRRGRGDGQRRGGLPVAPPSPAAPTGA